jgi:hypothetical protein
MVDNSTNIINRRINHLYLPQIIEHKKDHDVLGLSFRYIGQEFSVFTIWLQLDLYVHAAAKQKTKKTKKAIAEISDQTNKK